MKTIKQIADELGIDKQRVYRFIKKNRIKEVDQKNGVNQYDDTAQNLIISHFSQNRRVNDALQNHVKSDTVETLVDTLRHELEVKNKQIDELNFRLAEVTAALTAAQQSLQAEQALHAGTMQKTQLLEGDVSGEDVPGTSESEPTKQSFLKRFFHR